MFAVEWASVAGAGAFCVGLLAGVIVTVRLTRVLSTERRARDQADDELSGS